MELRLIEKLASREQVAALEARLTILERVALVKGGEVETSVNRLKQVVKNDAELNQFLDGKLDERSGQAWSTRDRAVAAMLALIAVCTFLINIFHPFANGAGP